MKISTVLRCFCAVIVCVVTGSVRAISYKDYVYRRASAGDLVEVLQVMDDIENSEMHQYIPLYPYTMRAHYVEELIRNKALFVATHGEDIISMAAVKLMPQSTLGDHMSCGDQVLPDDGIVVSSELWYTAPRYRKHGVLTTVLGLALQSLIPRLKLLVQQPPVRLYFMVDCVVTHERAKLFENLVALSATLFDEYVQSVRKAYFPKSTQAGTSSRTVCDIAQPFYNPFVHELEVAITRPAKRVVLSAIVQ
jgi:hypothetical protein